MVVKEENWAEAVQTMMAVGEDRFGVEFGVSVLE
jgi:hypothetical protein